MLEKNQKRESPSKVLSSESWYSKGKAPSQVGAFHVKITKVELLSDAVSSKWMAETKLPDLLSDCLAYLRSIGLFC